MAPRIATKPSRNRDLSRKAEVDREFRQAQEASEWPAAEHAAKMCPWRERLADGVLGPWYGPTTESAYEREMRAYQDTREAGSLWDEEEFLKQGPHRSAIRKATHEAERKDRDIVLRYLKRNVNVTPTDLRIGYAYWEDEASPGRIAAKLLLPEPTIISTVTRLRQKASGGDAR